MYFLGTLRGEQCGECMYVGTKFNSKCEPVKGEETQEAADLFDEAKAAQNTYLGGPVVAMFGGGLLALVGASYALYVTGDALSQGE